MCEGTKESRKQQRWKSLVRWEQRETKNMKLLCKNGVGDQAWGILSPAWTRAAVCAFSGLTWFNRSSLLQPQHWDGGRRNIWGQTNEFWLWNLSSLPGLSSWKDWGWKLTGSIELRINTSVQTFPAEMTNRKALSSLGSSCSLPQLKPRPSSAAPGSQGCDSRAGCFTAQGEALGLGLNIWQIPTSQGWDLQHLEKRSPESSAAIQAEICSCWSLGTLWLPLLQGNLDKTGRNRRKSGQVKIAWAL